jgi:amino acid adenylation domain-containing protein
LTHHRPTGIVSVVTQALRREHARFWQDVLAPGPTRVFAVQPGARCVVRAALPSTVASLAAGRPHGVHLAVAGAVVALLHRYTQAESVVIGQGAPLGGGIDGVGPATLIPLRSTVSGTDTVTDVVTRLRTDVFESYAHQNFAIDGSPFQVAVRVAGLHVDAEPAAVPLLLAVAEGELLAHGSGLDENVVRRFLRHVAAMLATPDTALDDVDLPTDSDRWHDTAHPGPHRTVLELFDRAVAKAPTARAVLSEQGALTYRELDERSDSLAASIVGADRVAIVMDRSPDLVVAVLAVVKAGAAFVPIDPSLPEERIDYVLRDSGATVVLRDANAPSGPRPAVPVRQDDPAYVIYTSGSTGEPKGVVVEHGALANLLAATQRAYPLGPDDVFLHKTSISFDVAVWELFGWLTGGGALALLPPGAERDPDAIIDAVDRYGVTVMDLVPQMLGAVADVIVARGAADRMRTLRLVSSGSDELSPDHVRRFRRALGAVRLVNFYGPTEATVQVTHHEVTGSPDRVPIGKPLDNVRLHVVDRRLRPQPVGVAGELCVAGDCLARGYLGRPELTAERFVQAPALGEERVYRTGDLCRRLDDGSLEFLGRIDQQVKVRGYRVEPGEIEHRLRACPGVTDAVVVASGESLVAYVTGTAPADILRRLGAVLPAYMVPAAVHRLPSFPVTAGGKIDRRALRPPTVPGSPPR